MAKQKLSNQKVTTIFHKKYLSESPKDTINFASRFAKALKAGDMLALTGNLGSGKTTFVKGIAKGLGVKNYKYVNSPTFVLIKEYKGKLPLYHFDLYRLDIIKDIEDLGSDEYFFGKGISVVEWADKCKALLPKNSIKIEFRIKGETKREIIIK